MIRRISWALGLTLVLGATGLAQAGEVRLTIKDGRVALVARDGLRLRPGFEHPLDLAIQMGSTFKALTTAMALDSGKVGINSSFDTRGALHYGRFKINDYHGTNRVLTVPEIGTAAQLLQRVIRVRTRSDIVTY